MIACALFLTACLLTGWLLLRRRERAEYLPEGTPVYRVPLHPVMTTPAQPFVNRELQRLAQHNQPHPKAQPMPEYEN